MTRTPLFLVLFISLLLLPVAVAATGNYTTSFDNSEIVVINQSYKIDQTGTTPFIVWAGCILIGFTFLVLSFLSFPNGEEVFASILAWFPLGYAAFSSFSVDMLTGFGSSAITSNVSAKPAILLPEFALMENHIIYHFDVLAMFLFILLAGAIGNTYRIAANQKRLKEMAEIQPTFDERIKGGQPPPE